MSDLNGTPPYTFRYHRYMAPYDERHDTLAEAVRAWSAGEDYGELSGEQITDATGAVVVTKDEWSGTLWRACDHGTLAEVLADPDWRAAHAPNCNAATRSTSRSRSGKSTNGRR
jgi:hypothetical protein